MKAILIFLAFVMLFWIGVDITLVVKNLFDYSNTIPFVLPGGLFLFLVFLIIRTFGHSDAGQLTTRGDEGRIE